MEMFRFANSEYLWGLLVIPLLAVIFTWSRIARRKALKRFGNEKVLQAVDAVFIQKPPGI